MKYTVQYIEVQSNTVQQENQTDLSLYSTFLIKLSPFTNYSIEVAAVNEEDHLGLYSDIIYVQTEPEGNQSVPEIMVNGSKSLVLKTYSISYYPYSFVSSGSIFCGENCIIYGSLLASASFILITTIMLLLLAYCCRFVAFDVSFSSKKCAALFSLLEN